MLAARTKWRRHSFEVLTGWHEIVQWRTKGKLLLLYHEANDSSNFLAIEITVLLTANSSFIFLNLK